MEDWQKHLLILALVLISAFILPILLAGLGLVLSNYIHPLWYILFIFAVAAVIGYRNRGED